MSDNSLRILKILRNSRDYISGEDISVELGVSRSAVWKSIGKLRKKGYIVDAVSNRGYHLSEGIDLPISDEIHRYLDTECFGSEIVYMDSVDSTNSLAMTLAARGAAHGTVVTADQQTDGRGRMGRKWISPPCSNLYLSIILRPEVSPTEASQIPILSVVASIRALKRTVSDMSFGIKWPNDIYCRDRKISGTLCEMKAETDRVNHVVVGTGINVNMKPSDDSIRDIATSLFMETGIEYSRVRLASFLLEEFERVYNRWLIEGNLEFIIDEWDGYSLLKGKQVDVRTATRIVSGKVTGIARNGALKLELPDGTVRFVYAGDATLHGPSSGS
ncbi:MAG: biotin--[acetyl-CoA-carboxylase] ligase [Candidatus Aegiribacteria sp.]|nr:biotin--[acetyl-CoA-carboxylase] ligase [Candidatus Aegiribacteria sp.]